MTELGPHSFHDGPVNAVTVTTDGAFVISASDDETLKVWDRRSGKERRTFQAHADRVRDCAVSRDGRLVVSASDDSTLKIWDLLRGELLMTFAGHVAAVTACALSPDGRRLVSASWDGTLKVWDCASGRELSTLHGHTDAVSDCGVSLDGRLLVSAGVDRTLRLWDAHTGVAGAVLEGHTARVHGCAFSPDGSFIVSAGQDATLKLWLTSGHDLGTLEGHSDTVWDCAVSPDSSFIVSASADGTLRLWDASSGRELETLFGSRCCAVGPDGAVVSGGDDGIVRLWSYRAADLPEVQAAPSVLDDAVLIEPNAGDDAPRERHLDENVQFTVYRPRAIAPGEWHDMLAFAHLSDLPDDAPESEPHPVAEVRRLVRQKLGDDLSGHLSLTQDSAEAIPRSGELTFRPEVTGVEFNPPFRSFLWLESVHQEDFRLRARRDLDGQTLRGRLSVFLGGAILLADIALTFRVDSRHVTPEPMAVDRVRPYRKIFPSYSHTDSWVVDQFALFARALGDDYLRDVVALRSGEIWNTRLAELIDGADVFQLFWSWNAIDSPYVENEWRHALRLGRQQFIRPVYWHKPMPAYDDRDLPPEALTEHHFQFIEPNQWTEGGLASSVAPSSPISVGTRRVARSSEDGEVRELALGTRGAPLLLAFFVAVAAVVGLFLFGYWLLWP
jgi:mRNA-degrading endonuclease YafQ of YafQ-DinJ toxin-antitoxin module